jgi:DNA-binding CsgD family transcriptional regulator/tetratricopeptide (TPR) repeat protein
MGPRLALLIRRQPLLIVATVLATVSPMAVTFGRRDELNTLAAVVAEGRGAVISGSMGVGKSHLLRQFIAERPPGWSVSHIVANHAAATIPFGAVATMLPTIEAADQHALLRAAVDRFERLTQGLRPLLAVDDAHHLDAASTAFLHELCVTRGVPLVATVRSGDPLSLALAELFKEIDAHRIDLEVLPPPVARELVATALHVAPGDALVEGLSARSGGNPLFIGELVRAHRAAMPGGLTGQLRDLVRARLDTLPGGARTLMEYIAIGEPLSVKLDVVDETDLAELERAGLVATDLDDGTLVARTAHPLYGEVVRSALQPATFQLTAKRLAESMLAVDRRRGDALRLAGWLLDVGQTPEPRLAVEAAREAAAWLEIELAERLVAVALDQRADSAALFAAGELRRIAGDTETADRHFRQALELATTDDEIGEVALALAQLYGMFRNDPAAAIDVLDTAVQRIADPAKRLELGIERTVFTAMLGRYDDVLVAAATLLAHPDRDEWAEWGALSSALWAEVQLMRLDEVESHLARVHQLFGEVVRTRPGAVDLMWALEVTVLMERSELPAAVDRGLRWLRDAPRLGVPGGLTEFSVGQVSWMRGDVSEARAALGRAIAKVSLFDSFNTLPFVMAGAALVAVVDGDRAVATELLAAADAREAAANPMGQLWRRRAAGWMSTTSDPDAAVAAFVDGARMGRESGHAAWALLALHDAVLFDGAEAAAAELELLGALPVGAPFMSLMVRHGRARAADDVREIRSCAEAFEQAGASWYAANAWQAVARRAERDNERVRAATRAVVLAPATALGRHGAEIAELALSRRQIEIARLAATGTTSKAIAERMYLSPRTVDNHLQRIYRRLGIEGRSALAGVVGPASLEPSDPMPEPDHTPER